MDNTDYFLRNEIIKKLGSNNFALFLQAENEEKFNKDMEERQKENDNNEKRN